MTIFRKPARDLAKQIRKADKAGRQLDALQEKALRMLEQTKKMK